MTPIRNDHGRFRSPHANMIGPARHELPPHVKEGRNKAVGRPNQRSTPRRNPRSQPGARRREERGQPSEPGLFTFIITRRMQGIGGGASLSEHGYIHVASQCL